MVEPSAGNSMVRNVVAMDATGGSLRSATAAGVVLTVMMPVFNEEETLPKTIDAISAYAAEHPGARFVFVNDGSRDGTERLLRSRLEMMGGAEILADGSWRGPRDARVCLLSFSQNRGKGQVVRSAMLIPDTEFVCFMDGDLAYSPEEHLEELIAGLRSADVVIGSRRESPEERRNTKKLRRFMGWVFNKLVRVLLGLPFDDTQAGVKGFRRAAAKTIFSRSTLSGFSFDIELLFIARQHGLKIGEIPAKVARAHRKKPTKVNLAAEPVRMLRDLLRVRWNWVRGRYR